MKYYYEEFLKPPFFTRKTSKSMFPILHGPQQHSLLYHQPSFLNWPSPSKSTMHITESPVKITSPKTMWNTTLTENLFLVPIQKDAPPPKCPPPLQHNVMQLRHSSSTSGWINVLSVVLSGLCGTIKCFHTLVLQYVFSIYA